MATRQLVVRLGDQILLTTSFSRPSLTIGRLPDNNVVLPNAGVSQHHAEIRIESQGAVLTDLESEGGTVIDGVRLLPLQPHILKDGAAIEIGPYLLVYRFQEDELRRESANTAVENVPQAVPDMASRRLRLTPDYLETGNGHRPGGYLQFLPVIFQDNDFLARYLQIFEAIWEPLEQRQEHIATYLNPRTCPSALLPWFAGWFGLALNPHWPEVRVRALLAEAIELYRWRGTKYGLARMIEVCTGLKPEITDVASETFVFRVTVRLPEDGSVDANYLEELIRSHKPAHAGYRLEVL